jgi:hypothetical protein
VKVQVRIELSKTRNRHQNNYLVIISFLLSVTALNIFHFIPQGLYCSFTLKFLEMKTFYTRNTFLVQRGSPKDIFNCLCKGKGQTETRYYQRCHFQKDCTYYTPVLQSTLLIMISSVPMLFFCNSTTISEKILIWQDCIILYLAKTMGFTNRSV